MIDIEKALQRLSTYELEYIIVGGVAATYHGATYATYDLDICYRRTHSNLEKLVSALLPLHPRLRGAAENVPFQLDLDTLKAELNFTLTTDIGDLDIFGELSGLGDYEQLISKSVETEIYGMRCRILSLDALITTKRRAGRQKDIAVALELEAIKELLEKKSTNERQR